MPVSLYQRAARFEQQVWHHLKSLGAMDLAQVPSELRQRPPRPPSSAAALAQDFAECPNLAQARCLPSFS